MAALLVTTLLGFIGLVIDAGALYAHRRQVQNAADEGALAAAHELRYGGTLVEAAQAARDYALGDVDDDDDDDGDDDGYGGSGSGVSRTVTVHIPPTSGEHIGDADFVEVLVDEAPRTFFVHTVLSQGATVSARGVAGLTDGDGDYGLLLLNESECRSLDVSGSGALIVNGGGIMVDSNCADEAFKKRGSSSVIADMIDIVGGYDGPTSGCPPPDPLDPPNHTVCPNPRTGRPFVADPLAGLAPPDLGALGISPDSGGISGDPEKQHISNGDYTFRPGVYYGGIQLSTNGNIVFEPGVYVMAGGGLDISSSGTVDGNGVMFYNTYDPGDPTSSKGRCDEFHISGSTDTGSTITGPTSGPYQDIVFWQDDGCLNNSGDGVRFHHSGSGTLQTSGIIYMPTGWMHITGGGSTGALQIIVDRLDKSGSSDVIIDYQSFVEIAPPAVSLVE